MYDMTSSMVEVCNTWPKESCMNVMLLTASHRAVIVILGNDRHHSSVLLLPGPSQPPSPPWGMGQAHCPSTHLRLGNFGGSRLSRLRLFCSLRVASEAGRFHDWWGRLWCFIILGQWCGMWLPLAVLMGCGVHWPRMWPSAPAQRSDSHVLSLGLGLVSLLVSSVLFLEINVGSYKLYKGLVSLLFYGSVVMFKGNYYWPVSPTFLHQLSFLNQDV